MIIWSGWGILVPILYIISFVITEGFTEWVTGDSLYFQHHTWLTAVAVVLGGVLIFLASAFLQSDGKVLLDPQTGKKVLLKSSHSFFFIPLEFWSFIGLLLLPFYYLG